MAPHSSRNMKTKEVKVPHLTIANRKKMESWGLGGLFAIDWSGTYDNLLEELATKQKAAVPNYEYCGKPEEWTSEVWREVYNLPKASLEGYIMKGKVQFTELQLLRVVKGDRWLSKSGVFLEQVKGNSDFVLFCQMLNAIFAPVRPKHFQHNLLAFYHHAWAVITNPTAPTPDWGDAVEKIVSRQIKDLGVCNKATCLGPYLAHLYSHFHEMDAKEKEDSKKRKASIQTVSNSDTKIKTEDEKEPPKEVPRVFCEGEANGSKPLGQKLEFAKWGNRVESLGHETSRLFEAFHVEIGSVIAEEGPTDRDGRGSRKTTGKMQTRAKPRTAGAETTAKYDTVKYEASPHPSPSQDIRTHNRDIIHMSRSRIGTVRNQHDGTIHNGLGGRGCLTWRNSATSTTNDQTFGGHEST
ncbi:hypothetical protein R1flu_018431 [Riccia fluitans]|uniref:Aminotransferase-like plant mobile domain-containing protein n=1 Tax=Riccia fluitans TaxID=41844 RepID=A0ABD1ZFU1_9MARC